MAEDSALLIGHSLSGGRVQYNVRVKENHELDARVTVNTIENGEVITDHVILLPKKLTLEFEQTNAFDGKQKAIDAWTELKIMWEDRIPFNVLTYHDSYPNMVIEKVGAIHEAPNKGSLRFSVTLKQINIVSLKIISTSVSDTAVGASKETEGGVTNPLFMTMPA